MVKIIGGHFEIMKGSSHFMSEEEGSIHYKAINHITGHIEEHIQQLKWTTDVKMEVSGPCASSKIENWEEENGVRLPNDIQDFFSITDGLSFTWHAFFPKTKSTIKNRIEIKTGIETKKAQQYEFEPHLEKELLGSINIPCFERLKYMRKDAFITSNQYDQSLFLNENVDICIIELETIEHIGTVYLCHGFDFQKAVTNTSMQKSTFSAVEYSKKNNLDQLWTVWFKTEAGKWYPMTSSFMSYFRLSLVHFGIIGW